MVIRTDSAGLTRWVEVDLSALKHNLTQVRAFVSSSVKIMAVVKANAYGHGAVQTSRAFLEAGADFLGVTTLEEALELRESGIQCRILVFSPLLPDQMKAAVCADLDQTVCDLQLADAASTITGQTGRVARVHVKVDTGMGRLGVLGRECPDFVGRLSSLANLEIAAIYTHFANAGSVGLADAQKQLSMFDRMIQELRTSGVVLPPIHAANSAAVLSLPEARFNMVRPGTILYGQVPARHLQGVLDLRESWCLKTRIVALRSLPIGARVGYGSDFTARRPTLSAVLPIGYSDGFTLIPESVGRRECGSVRQMMRRVLRRFASAFVIVRGHKAPVIGRVSMQMCSVDVTEIPYVSVGDEVVVPARRTSVSGRIERVYIE